MSVPDFVRDDLAKLELRIGDDRLALLARYLDELLAANERVNLTGVRERDVAWLRLIIDSLTALPGLEDAGAGARIVDVGCGGGLPGVPLAICRADLSFTLIEATGKKARFCEQVAAMLGLDNIAVINARAEEVGQQREHRERYDLAVCRAIGPMRELLEYALPLVRVGGALLAMKGPSVEEEMAAAGDALTILGGGDLHIFEAYPPPFDIRTVIVHVTKAQPTPRKYPRAPGTPRHEPL